MDARTVCQKEPFPDQKNSNALTIINVSGSHSNLESDFAEMIAIWQQLSYLICWWYEFGFGNENRCEPDKWIRLCFAIYRYNP